MSSRKTYFGIGWSGKDPTATEKSQDGDDRSDYSAPTVVDDAKVAEGLKQLRAWYQPDPDAPAVPDDRESVVDSPSEPTKLGMPYPRPTAVGHATATGPQQAEQRPALPDPMRGTMFGHDVHRPEFDNPAGEPAGAAGALGDRSLVPLSYPVVDDGPPRNAETAQHSAEAVPDAQGPAAGEAAPFADFLRREAERPRRMGAFHLSRPDDTDSIAVPRARMTARILFAAFGVAAFVSAVVVWLQSGTPEPMPSDPTFGVSSNPGLWTPSSADPGAARAAAAAAGSSEAIKPAVPPVDTVRPAPRAGLDVAAPAVRVPPKADVTRPPTVRATTPETPARTTATETPRRTATTKTAGVKTIDEDDSSAGATDTAAVAVPAPAPAAATTLPAEKVEKVEPRPRTGRSAARKADLDAPTGKQDDPDSTLPPSEE
jgi:hypothetical protein